MPTQTPIADRVAASLHPLASYGRDVARGYQRLSGADLAGKARSFGYSYSIQRQKVAKHWRAEGGHVRRVKRGGRLVLVDGPVPAGAEQGACSVGECWVY